MSSELHLSSDHLAEKQYEKEKIFMVYRSQWVTLPGNFVLSGFFAIWYAFLSGHYAFYLTWYAVFCAFLLFRVRIAKAFNREHAALSAKDFNAKKWERIVNVMLLATAAQWSAFAIYSIMTGKQALFSLTIVLLNGVAATGIISYPGYKFITKYWTPAVIFPMAVPIYFGPFPEYRFFVVAIIFFYVAALSSAKNHLALVLDIFKEKEKNRKLVQDLNQTLSDLKGKNDQIQDLQQQQIQSSKMAALGEMAGGIAHEINNPLATIKIRATQIKRIAHSNPINFEKLDQAVTNIDTTTDRISSIIKGLRNFARDGESDPYEQASVNKIIDESLDLCRAKLLNREIDIRWKHIEPDIDIECKQVQVSQVILNLISNSVDAIGDLSVKWIEISVQDLGDKVMISVADAGLGIPPDVAHKIMQPFFTTKEIGKGTGLGLSISVGIIRAHHGEFFYDSAAVNTTFRVVLPKRYVESSDNASIASSTAITSNSTSQNKAS